RAVGQPVAAKLGVLARAVHDGEILTPIGFNDHRCACGERLLPVPAEELLAIPLEGDLDKRLHPRNLTGWPRRTLRSARRWPAHSAPPPPASLAPSEVPPCVPHCVPPSSTPRTCPCAGTSRGASARASPASGGGAPRAAARAQRARSTRWPPGPRAHRRGAPG